MSAVLAVGPLGFPWKTFDPFLFCAHHDDAYPKGNAQLGPAESLAGRRLGSDFARKDGWSMYHGRAVPGFPQHPHRGFETISIVRRGYIDHSDSIGAAGRIGPGDVQWMTAGKGIVHSEMFPLLDAEGDNHMEMFQLWINLPAHNKLVDPGFTMFWDHAMPRVNITDSQGRAIQLKIVAGQYDGAKAPPPPAHSWASADGSDVAIWTIRLAAGAEFTIPGAHVGSNRTLYFYRGESVTIDDRTLSGHSFARVAPDVDVTIRNGPQPSELLMMQGRPIGEPVAHHGPFVMNTMDELRQAYSDYQRTRFGKWPWPSDSPTHGSEQGRFALHADGRREDV